MSRPIGQPRTITGAQDQLETLRIEIEVASGVIRYHRQRVVRDGSGSQVGAAGSVETVHATIADMPAADKIAANRVIDHGDTL